MSTKKILVAHSSHNISVTVDGKQYSDVAEVVITNAAASLLLTDGRRIEVGSPRKAEADEVAVPESMQRAIFDYLDRGAVS